MFVLRSSNAGFLVFRFSSSYAYSRTRSRRGEAGENIRRNRMLVTFATEDLKNTQQLDVDQSMPSMNFMFYLLMFLVSELKGILEAVLGISSSNQVKIFF